MPMNFISLINDKNNDTFGKRPVTIGFLGDSVTNGCFELFQTLSAEEEEGYDTVYDLEHCYSSYVKKILNRLYPKAQINIINAGISGDTAHGGLARIKRDLLIFQPDLTVVCYGLNDCQNGKSGMQKYSDSMRAIVRVLKENGSEVIVMTPQPICTRLHERLSENRQRNIAMNMLKIYQDGIFDGYMQLTRDVAKEEQAVLCDTYEKWMCLQRGGVDITNLLSNYINHPARDMHWLFAISLIEAMFL